MTRTEIIALAKQCGARGITLGVTTLFSDSLTIQPSQLEAFFHAAQQAEREACAKVCESLFDMDDDSCNEAELCAAAIRKRGTK